MVTAKPARVLCMEDDPGLARLVQRRLTRAGYIVDVAHDGEEGLTMATGGSYDVVAVDQVMPIHEGLEVIRIMASLGPLPPVIMVTGSGNEQVAVEAMKLGASDYLVKDTEGRYLELLPSVIERALQQKRLVEAKQRAEEKLRQYAADLKARNEELDAFAHTVAHDLKGPLGYLSGFSEVLVDSYGTMQDKERIDILDMIAQTGHKMVNIVDELLLLAGLREVDPEMAPLDMGTIVEDAQKRLAYLIEEYRAEILLPDAWPVALGYGPWLEEVWVNYISNALKYGGQPPRVELGYSIPDRFQATEESESPGPKSETGWVHFWVQDNGLGLTPEEQARLFTPFTRLDQVRAKGHGLGLSIVRRIVEKLGGQVEVESETGQGSVFGFRLRMANNTNDM